MNTYTNLILQLITNNLIEITQRSLSVINMLNVDTVITRRATGKVQEMNLDTRLQRR